MFSRVKTFMEILPDVIERDVGMTPEQVIGMIEANRRLGEVLYQQLVVKDAVAA